MGDIQHEESWLKKMLRRFRLMNHKTASCIWGVFGIVASLVFAIDEKWELGAILVAPVFVVIFYVAAYYSKGTPLMRQRRRWLGEALCNVAVAIITTLFTTLVELEKKSYEAQISLAIVVFGCTEIAKPISDFGLVQFFLLNPIAKAYEEGDPSAVIMAFTVWLIFTGWQISFLFDFEKELKDAEEVRLIKECENKEKELRDREEKLLRREEDLKGKRGALQRMREQMKKRSKEELLRLETTLGKITEDKKREPVQEKEHIERDEKARTYKGSQPMDEGGKAVRIDKGKQPIDEEEKARTDKGKQPIEEEKQIKEDKGQKACIYNKGIATCFKLWRGKAKRSTKRVTYQKPINTKDVVKIDP